MSVYYDILSKVREIIVTYGPIAASGTIPAIPTENIVIRKIPISKEAVEMWKAECLSPGIVIGFSGKVTSDPTEGSNSHDVVKYPVTIVGIDRDFGTFETARVQAWLDRMEQLRKLFHMANLRAEVPEVTLSWAEPQDVFEERYSSLYDYAVFVLPLVFKNEESRDSDGTG